MGSLGVPRGATWDLWVPLWHGVGVSGALLALRGGFGSPSWHGMGSSGLSRKFTTDRGQHGSVVNFCDRSLLATSPCPSSRPHSPLVLDAGFPPAQMC